MKYNILGEFYSPRIKLPLSRKFAPGELVQIDLSDDNPFMTQAGSSTEKLGEYIQNYLRKQKAVGCFGGYAEKRNLYRRSDVFNSGGKHRNIHLGIDFWLDQGTEVVAPLPGMVHSLANNANAGDYGPTVVLVHFVANDVFHSLYGHLDTECLERLAPGQLLKRGDTIGYLGSPEVNKDWPPHLHFQLIRDMEGCMGDYPGVCAEDEMEKYFANCPNPLVFFGKQWIDRLFGKTPV